MDGNDPFSRELRSARDRIAELQRRSGTASRPGRGLLPEALAELDGPSKNCRSPARSCTSRQPS